MWRFLATLCTFCLAIATASRAAEPFVQIKTGAWSPGSFNEPWSISPDGGYVVGYTAFATGSPYLGFLWSEPGGMVALTSPTEPGTSSRARAVSEDGSVVVGEVFPTGSTWEGQPFRWTAEAGLEILQGCEPYDPEINSAWGVSDDGGIIVGTCRIASNRIASVMWSNSITPVVLIDPPDRSTGRNNALGVSAYGDFVCGYIVSNATASAYRWSAGLGAEILPSSVMPDADAFAVDISDDGRIVVGLLADGAALFACRWKDDEEVSVLPSIPGESTKARATAVSGDGTIVVGEAAFGSSAYRAVYWDAEDRIHVLQEELPARYGIDLADWELTSTSGISSDGSRMTGTGIWKEHSLFEREVGWVFDRPPGPPRFTAMQLSGANIIIQLEGLIPQETNVVERRESPNPESWSPRMSFTPTSSTESLSLDLDDADTPEWLRVRTISPQQQD